MLGAVWVLYVADWVLTYVLVFGMAGGDLTLEANPLLVWTFEIGYIYGLLLRILSATALVLLIRWLRVRGCKSYRLIVPLLAAYMIGLWTYHLYWISYL